MMPYLLMLIIFVATTIVVASIGTWLYDRFIHDRLEVRRRMNHAFSTEATPGRRTALFRDLKLLHTQTTLDRQSLWYRVATAIEQAGFDLQPMQLLSLAGGLSLVVAVATGVASPSPWLSLPAGLLGFAAPFLFIELRRRARIRKLCAQLPLAFDQMKRAIRAGQSVTGAMQLVAGESKPPLTEEFAICCQQQELGLPFRTSMRDLARRTGVMELQILTVALLVQRESGGNCADILSNLSEVVRKRLRLVGRVKALTSEGRLQALVLSVLPIAAFVAIFVLNREYADVLLQRPWLLAGLVASEIMGALWIRRIVTIEY